MRETEGQVKASQTIAAHANESDCSKSLDYGLLSIKATSATSTIAYPAALYEVPAA
ncbi:hypothetical protein ACFVUS_24145 [Nocardia sp. NPDC058058]|uniref:hypothetical protein n=1 Tax=Nocardia sp. NPDC058058 TaxID=3346317 RepID=UPI0036DCE93D